MWKTKRLLRLVFWALLQSLSNIISTIYTMYLTLGNWHIIVPLPFQTSWTLALVIFVIYEIEELVH